jgi:hypothetical protein
MKRGVAGFGFVLALAIVPWVVTSAYMKSAGAVVTGKVLDKRETFLLPGGDSWRHIFEITYEYRPLDSANSETVVQRVDSTLYRSVRTGGPIQVRYSPSPLLRSFAGMGLYLENSSPWSRLHYGPPAREDIAMTVALLAAAIFGLLAYLKKSITLGSVAVVIAGVCFPLVLLGACAFVAFPALFWASRSNPAKGYGFALVAAIVLSVAVVYWRMPRPSSVPAGPIHNGMAVVRQIRVVDEIWSNTWEIYSGHRAGEKIGPQFEMVDLEFTPEAATEPVHFLDRIDLDSIPNIHEGSKVPIRYSAANPDRAEIADGTHTYVWRTTAYLSTIAFGAGAIVTFVFVPVRRMIGRLFGSTPAAFARLSELNKWPEATEEDLARKQLEELVRAKRSRGRGT